MKKIFSSTEVSEAMLVHDALLHQGIEASIPNEHASYTTITGVLIPAEVWIRADDEFDRAAAVVKEALSTLRDPSDRAPWRCSRCKEENPDSFEACWSCERPRSSRTA